MDRVRVERALRLLPAVDAMEPLRALLVSTPRADEQSAWASSGPYLTVGKHGVDVEALRHRADALIPRIAERLATLFSAYIGAVAALEMDDAPSAVAALAEGGAAEEKAQRIAEASAWYDVAFRLAVELHDRGPEIEMLERLGRVAHVRARYDEAARYYQRALVLAESAFANGAAIRAAIGLGLAADARDELDGAHAWYLRALRQAESAANTEWIATLEHRLGRVAWRQGDIAKARERLQRARDLLEGIGAHEELARALSTYARLECSLGNKDLGVTTAREALAWSQRAANDHPVKVETLLAAAEVFVACDLLLDTEQMLRRAEALAIEYGPVHKLVEVYVALGRLSATRADATGFVFFEQGADLCRTLAPQTSLEGRLYEEYGKYRSQLGEHEEARAHLERARQIFESMGDSASLSRLRLDLAKLINERQA